MVSTEKALLLKPFQVYTTDERLIEKYGVVYIGSDFCAHLVPSFADMQYFWKRFSKDMVLTTPLLTGHQLRKVECLVDKVSSCRRNIEIVTNDLGLLYALQKKRVRIILGKVIISSFKNMPIEFLTQFCREYRIERIEIDDVSFLDIFPKNIKISLHHPLRFLSLTRFCPFGKTIPRTCECPCKERHIVFSHPYMKDPLLLDGNAYFLMQKIPAVDGRISRFVYSPLKMRNINT